MRRLLALSLLICSLACGCAAGLAAPAALAAGSTSSGNALTGSSSAPSFGITSGGAATTPQVQTVAATPTTSSSGSALSGSDGIIIAIVAAIVLGGIAFYIWNDARGHAARVGHGGEDEGLFGQRAHAGSKAPRKPRKLKPAERRRRKRGRAR